MSSAAEIKAQIQAAIEQINEAVSAATTASTQAEGGIATGAATTQDTNNQMPGEALGQWQQAQERLDEAVMLFQSGNSTFEQYMNVI